MAKKNPTAKEMGRVGGKAKGDAKRRSLAHYKRISVLGHLKRGHKIKNP